MGHGRSERRFPRRLQELMKRRLQSAFVLTLFGGLIASTNENNVRPRKSASRWTSRKNLGPAINRYGMKVGAVFSPSGRSLLFSRHTQGPESGEFFVWYEHGLEAWPPDCPAEQR